MLHKDVVKHISATSTLPAVLHSEEKIANFAKSAILPGAAATAAATAAGTGTATGTGTVAES